MKIKQIAKKTRPDHGPLFPSTFCLKIKNPEKSCRRRKATHTAMTIRIPARSWRLSPQQNKKQRILDKRMMDQEKGGNKKKSAVPNRYCLAGEFEIDGCDLTNNRGYGR